jgi:hypothetical protein
MKKDALRDAIANQEIDIEFIEPVMLEVIEPGLEKRKTAIFGQRDASTSHQNGKEKLTE